MNENGLSCIQAVSATPLTIVPAGLPVLPDSFSPASASRFIVPPASESLATGPITTVPLSYFVISSPTDTYRASAGTAGPIHGGGDGGPGGIGSGGDDGGRVKKDGPSLPQLHDELSKARRADTDGMARVGTALADAAKFVAETHPITGLVDGALRTGDVVVDASRVIGSTMPVTHLPDVANAVGDSGASIFRSYENAVAGVAKDSMHFLGTYGMGQMDVIIMWADIMASAIEFFYDPKLPKGQRSRFAALVGRILKFRGHDELPRV